MPLFKFDDFTFDSTNHKLSHKGTKVEIRPKALKLLNLLIQNRHRILSKAEIMSSVWDCDYPRDHLLFQLIGELRKDPLKSEFVRTQPNEGYQWCVTTHVIDTTLLTPRVMVASFAAALLGLSLFVLPVPPKIVVNKPTAHLPAYSALSKGIIALENGDNVKAIQWFQFALVENPDSVESSIFLAETLYQQNRHEESSKYLQTILDKKSTSAYNKATASNILSKISERQGKFDEALRHAHKSGDTNILGKCSIEFVEQRINMIESRIAMSPVLTDHEQASVNKIVDAQEDYAYQCSELNKRLDETSSCLPLKSESIAHFFSDRGSRLNIS